LPAKAGPRFDAGTVNAWSDWRLRVRPLRRPGLSTREQQYDPTSVINEVRQTVDAWRSLPNPGQWQVTPETARLLQHWRHHKFSDARLFFCQVKAVETAIWLTEVAPLSRNGKRLLDHLASANKDATLNCCGLR
jgi:type III restriction enzyme